MEIRGKNDYKIYCLDDDPAICDAICKILQSSYWIDSYIDPFLCLSDALEKGCDFLITDIKMPKMDGVELIRRFRQHFPFAPVVIITGFASIEMAQRGIEAGANELLEKPLDRTVLLATVEKLLAGYAVLKTFQKEYHLTKMEFMTLQYILAGRTSKEMSFITKRSARTMESHRYELMKKCGADNIMGLLTNSFIIEYMKCRHKNNEIEISSAYNTKEIGKQN